MKMRTAEDLGGWGASDDSGTISTWNNRYTFSDAWKEVFDRAGMPTQKFGGKRIGVPCLVGAVYDVLLAEHGQKDNFRMDIEMERCLTRPTDEITAFVTARRLLESA